jgi:phosphate/sulfate permease
MAGIAIGNAVVRGRSLVEGVHWSQVWKVLEALAISPVLGFVLSAVIYFVLRRTVRDKRIYEPAKDHPPVWWMRGVLIAKLADNQNRCAFRHCRIWRPATLPHHVESLRPAHAGEPSRASSLLVQK